MAKAERVDFEAIKAAADFGAVLAHYDLRPIGQGDQVKILCPFHDDARPSCSINLARRVFHCFGCDAEGNVLEFVHRMETRNGAAASLRAAGQKLATICGLEGHGEPLARAGQKAARGTSGGRTGQSSRKRPEGASRVPAPPETALAEERRPTFNKPLGFTLTLDPEHPYLRERRLPRSVIEAFGLGFCAKGSMAGRLCIPIHNVRGELVAYAGRWAGPLEELPEGEDKYKLPKGFQKSLQLFNLHRVKEVRHLVVVEGYFGVMRLHRLGMPTVGLMGSSIADEQVKLLLEHCPNLVFITVLMDGDEPGRKAEAAVVPPLARHFWVWAASLPDGQQPDTVDEAFLRSLV